MLKELTQRYVAAFDKKDLHGCAALMHDTFALEDPVVKRVDGKEAALAAVAKG
jgi:ketosteroid isomerase-like protein